MTDPLPVAFADARPEQFPLRIYAFDPEGTLVWQRVVEQPYVMVDIPGIKQTQAPVQYVVFVDAEGTGMLYNDPTCGGLFDYEPKQEEEPFDCAHCGDGDALRAGEACAYCGRVAGVDDD